MKKTLDEIATQDGRFSPQMLKFVYEGLGFTIKKLAEEPGHIKGQTLCDGLRQMALEKWGRLAMLVLNCGGVKSTKDFGEIVYLMIDHKWMSSQPTDSIEDFENTFDFKTAFKDNFHF